MGILETSQPHAMVTKTPLYNGFYTLCLPEQRTQGITTEALWYGHCQFASEVSLQKFAWWVRFCCKKNIRLPKRDLKT